MVVTQLFMEGIYFSSGIYCYISQEHAHCTQAQTIQFIVRYYRR